MKIFNKKFIILLTSIGFLYSCAKLDDKVEGIEVEKPASVIVDTKINSYDVLTAYSGDLLLGAVTTADNISGEGALVTLFETNFSEVTPTSELNCDEILSDEGEYDFSSMETFLSNASQLGLSAYGDAIISNEDQNDTYLATLGASLTYLTPLYPNEVSSDVIEDGSFTDWTVNGDISIEDYMGEPSIKMVNGSSAGSGDVTSLQSPVYTVEDETKFELTFYVLATQEGEGRVTFTGLNDNEPEMDWLGTGDESTATFTTKVGWNTIQVQTLDFDGSGEFSFKIEMGYTADVTYYINIQGLSLVNLYGSVENIDEIYVEAESGDIGSEWVVKEDEDASDGKYVLANSAENYLTPNEDGSEPYIINYTFNVNTAGTYNVWVRGIGPSGNDDSFFLSVNGSSFVFSWWSLYSSAWAWTKVGSYTLSEGENKFATCIRENGWEMDRFYFTLTTNEPSGVGSAVISQEEVTLEVSDDVKKTAVETALSEYVTNVLTNLGDEINPWTVVKNPFDEDGSIAVSSEDSDEGTYYWGDYIGSDFISQAFSAAKANATSENKFFISETDLNTNTNKLSAVVSLLTSNSDIDGVAVNLNVDLDMDVDKLSDMFDQLVATGKLVYISNLKIMVSDVDDDTYDALAGEVFQSIVEKYNSNIPTAQQYGISLYTPIDDDLDDDQYSYDYIGLWDADYNRKQTYMWFVEGF